MSYDCLNEKEATIYWDIKFVESFVKYSSNLNMTSKDSRAEIKHMVP